MSQHLGSQPAESGDRWAEGKRTRLDHLQGAHLSGGCCPRAEPFKKSRQEACFCEHIHVQRQNQGN